MNSRYGMKDYKTPRPMVSQLQKLRCVQWKLQRIHAIP